MSKINKELKKVLCKKENNEIKEIKWRKDQELEIGITIKIKYKNRNILCI